MDDLNGSQDGGEQRVANTASTVDTHAVGSTPPSKSRTYSRFN